MGTWLSFGSRQGTNVQFMAAEALWSSWSFNNHCKWHTYWEFFLLYVPVFRKFCRQPSVSLNTTDCRVLSPWVCEAQGMNESSGAPWETPAGLSQWVLYRWTQAIPTSSIKVAYKVGECSGRVAWVFWEQALRQIALGYHSNSTPCFCASLGLLSNLSVPWFPRL